MPNPDYKGKGTAKPTSSMPTRVERHCSSRKIHGPPETMEFSNESEEEQKEQAFDDLVAALR